jgi:cyclopropane fatty-acyl-phospholipid synthase-like methyltransferase
MAGMSMDWVEPFYVRQHTWLADYYQAAVNDRHRTIAAKIPRLASGPPGRVLELGAGGGQVAAATADRGFNVTAVELVEQAVAQARTLVPQERAGQMTIVPGDFYTVEVAGAFDAVTYWDGFGIGSDADQRRLLRRVTGWLHAAGRALIEIYTPWFAAGLAGREQRFEQAVRRYSFDAEGCRMIDSWWPVDDEAAIVSQSLRCYSPADLRLLLEGTGLRLTHLEAGGGVDPDTGAWADTVPLDRAISYVAVLVRTAG